jgi:hypothetical protein
MATFSSGKVDADGKLRVFDLRVPLALALGLYERLTDKELEEHYYDIKHEYERRGNAA